MTAGTMFAASAGRRLTLVDPSTFKQISAPPSPSKQTALDVEFTALTWSYDNSALFVACDGAIRRYDAAGHFEKVIYSTKGRISSMVAKDNQTIIFAKEDKAYALNCEKGECIATYEGHFREITSMSLSKDCSLLATASASGCIVSDFGISNQIVLQGIPDSDSTNSICVFHLHSRSRLILCSGRTVYVFDVIKPSTPAKTVVLSSKVTGDIVAATCSPFSKSLAAVATSDGSVCLVDLDAEKGHFKSTDFQTPLTSLAFTGDGAALLAGTGSGQLLMIDLHSFKDEPKKITINGEGKRVVGISVQRRVKKTTNVFSHPVSPAQRKRVSSKASPEHIRPLATQDPNLKSEPAARRVSAPTTTTKSPAQTRAAKPAGTLGRIPGTPMRRTSGAKGVTTPHPGIGKRLVYSTLTSSMSGVENATEDDEAERLQALSTLVAKRRTTSKPAAQVKSPVLSKADGTISKTMTSIGATSSGISPAARRTRKVSTASSGPAKTMTKAVGSVSSTTKSSTTTVRGRKALSSPKGSEPRSPVKRISVGDRNRLDLPDRPRTRTISNSTSVSAALAARRKAIGAEKPRAGSSASRASSPDLDELSIVLPSPTTNLSEVLRAEAKKTHAKSRLKEEIASGAGMPNEMDGWPISGAEPSKADRRVDFEFDYEAEGDGSKIEEIDSEDEGEDKAEKNKEDVELQVSPCRPSTNTSVQLTPLRRPTPPHNAFHFGGPGNTNSPYGPMPFPSTPASAQKAQEFMRSLISSAMHNFQQETRAELMGMHLDMLRMGREWKKELREVLAEVRADELKELREENKRLREENERLRVVL